jgi:hypothetical protein
MYVPEPLERSQVTTVERLRTLENLREKCHLHSQSIKEEFLNHWLKNTHKMMVQPLIQLNSHPKEVR